MNCHETRELLSALLDETLAVREREEVQAHLDHCPDCRRELDSLRSTVSLLSRVQHPRAPVGFVDKVMAEVRPVPWYRRLGRMIFLPLAIKLPLEAGAMIVIVVLGVYLLQSTPELRDAARPDLPAVSSRAEAPPAASPPAPTPAPAPDPLRERDARQNTGIAPAPVGGREAAEVSQPSRDALAPAEVRQEAKKEALQQSARSAAPPAASEAEKPEAAPPPPALSKTLDTREGSLGRADGDRQKAPGGAPAAPSILSAKQQVAPPTVSGLLTVKDRQQTERALSDLISKTGARETGRRQEGTATVVDLVVPQAGYAAFVRELAGLGSFKIDGEPAEVPPLVRLSIRISE
jgi:Putative zinc-finger